MIEEYGSETDSEYTAYWRDWVGPADFFFFSIPLFSLSVSTFAVCDDFSALLFFPLPRLLKRLLFGSSAEIGALNNMPSLHIVFGVVNCDIQTDVFFQGGSGDTELHLLPRGHRDRQRGRNSEKRVNAPHFALQRLHSPELDML